MSALAIILTAAMMAPGNGPEMVSGEVEQGLDLSGEWEGTLSYRDSYTINVTLTRNRLIGTGGGITLINDWKVDGDGSGRFGLTGPAGIFLRIYQWRSESILLCYRKATCGRPTNQNSSPDTQFTTQD